MFSDAGPDVRWIGNERGVAGTTNWSTVDPRIVTVPGMTGDDVMRSLQDGDRDGTVWRPGETDVSIRPGWFHHPAEDSKVRTAADLVHLYFTSVGRNSKLLLNVPPGRDGLLHTSDVASLSGMRAKLTSMFATDVAANGRRSWTVTGPQSAIATVTFRAPDRIAIIDVREQIAEGQRVARYRIEGHDGSQWRELGAGTTIGYRRLTEIPATTLRAIRVTIEETLERPRTVGLRCYRAL
jgi:alpha-L-fucosidase